MQPKQGDINLPKINLDSVNPVGNPYATINAAANRDSSTGVEYNSLSNDYDYFDIPQVASSSQESSAIYGAPPAQNSYGAPPAQNSYGAPAVQSSTSYGSPSQGGGGGFSPGGGSIGGGVNPQGVYDPFAFQGANSPKTTPKPNVDAGLGNDPEVPITTRPVLNRPNNNNGGSAVDDDIRDTELVPDFQAPVNANLQLGDFESNKITGTRSPFGVSVASSFGGGKARRPKSSTTTTERPTRGTTTRFPGLSGSFFNGNVILTTQPSISSQEVDAGLLGSNINQGIGVNTLNRRPGSNQQQPSQQPERLTFNSGNSNRFNGGSGIFFSTPSTSFMTPGNFATPTPRPRPFRGRDNLFESEVAQGSQVNAKVIPRATSHLHFSNEDTKVGEKISKDILTNEISDQKTAAEEFIRRNMLMNIILKPGAGENSKVLPRPKVEVMSQGSNVVLVKLVFPENENIHGLRAFTPPKVNLKAKSRQLDELKSNESGRRNSREALIDTSNMKVLDGFIVNKDVDKSKETSIERSFDSSEYIYDESSTEKTETFATQASINHFAPSFANIQAKSFPVATMKPLIVGRFSPAKELQRFHAYEAIGSNPSPSPYVQSEPVTVNQGIFNITFVNPIMYFFC